MSGPIESTFVALGLEVQGYPDVVTLAGIVVSVLMIFAGIVPRIAWLNGCSLAAKLATAWAARLACALVLWRERTIAGIGLGVRALLLASAVLTAEPGLGRAAGARAA